MLAGFSWLWSTGYGAGWELCKCEKSRGQAPREAGSRIGENAGLVWHRDAQELPSAGNPGKREAGLRKRKNPRESKAGRQASIRQQTKDTGARSQNNRTEGGPKAEVRRAQITLLISGHPPGQGGLWVEQSVS